MGYKMKGFSGFKGSPLKGKGDNLKRIMTEKKIIEKQTGNWYAPGAEPRINDPSKMPKNWSKGVTPGYESTKMARDAVAQAKAVKAHDAAVSRLSTDPKTANLPKKEFDALLDKTSKSFTKQTTPKVAKDLVSKKPSGNIAQAFKGAKKALKVGGKIAGGLGIAATLYDMYKSGQEHSGGKAVKGQETGVVTPKTSIWDKK